LPRLPPKRSFSKMSDDYYESELPIASFVSPCFEIDSDRVQARWPDPDQKR
jgi:hypothetical protein